MGRIVFQCYSHVCEVAMTSALARRPFPLIPLVLLAACDTETSNERVLGIQAMSFANSEWSTPVNLAAINTAATDAQANLSPDELSLYFQSDPRCRSTVTCCSSSATGPVPGETTSTCRGEPTRTTISPGDRPRYSGLT